MICTRIILIVVLLQTILLVSGQFIFPNDDYPDYSNFEPQQQQQKQSIFNPPPVNNNLPRPRTTSTPAGRRTMGTTTTGRPLGLNICLQNCPVTSEYNPVCGTDRQSYNNRNVLRCNQACGVNVALSRIGPCQPRPM